jgi:hypothetical protein
MRSFVVVFLIACGDKEEPPPTPPPPVDRPLTHTPEDPVPEDALSAPAATEAGPCESAGARAEAEGNDAPEQATRIGTDPVSGTIGRKTDQDWFVIETCGEKLLRVELTNAPATGSAVDFRVELFGTDGIRSLDSLTHQDGSDGTTTLGAVFYVEEAERRFLRITDFGDDDHDPSSRYVLTVTVAAVPDAELEPNGNKNDATNRALAGALVPDRAASGFIASRGDEDWWKIDVGDDESLVRVEATNAPATRSDVDLRIAVFDSRGNELDSQELFDGDTGLASLRTVVYAAEQGSYYVRVSDHGEDDADSTVPYRVTAATLEVPDADIEPNGNANVDTNRALATPLASGRRGVVSFRGDEDFWKLEHPGGPIDLVLAGTAATSEVDFRMRVETVSGDQLAGELDYDGGDGMSRVEVHVPDAPRGTYFIIVTDNGDDEWDLENAYTITRGG